MPAIRRQNVLPWRKAVRIAWRSLRMRALRSLVLAFGIILPIAFLTYVAVSNELTLQLRADTSSETFERLVRQGILARTDQADAQIQTRWMVGLALLISFVGILNSMLMSVTERFREIGTMKCLGALDSFIVRLFLLESAFLGVVGASVGVAAGLILALGEALRLGGQEVLTLLQPGALGRYAGACLLAGIALTVFGSAFPAWRAAHMKPIDAMRSEA